MKVAAILIPLSMFGFAFSMLGLFAVCGRSDIVVDCAPAAEAHRCEVTRTVLFGAYTWTEVADDVLGLGSDVSVARRREHTIGGTIDTGTRTSTQLVLTTKDGFHPLELLRNTISYDYGADSLERLDAGLATSPPRAFRVDIAQRSSLGTAANVGVLVFVALAFLGVRRSWRERSRS